MFLNETASSSTCHCTLFTKNVLKYVALAITVFVMKVFFKLFHNYTPLVASTAQKAPSLRLKEENDWTKAVICA